MNISKKNKKQVKDFNNQDSTDIQVKSKKVKEIPSQNEDKIEEEVDIMTKQSSKQLNKEEQQQQLAKQLIEKQKSKTKSEEEKQEEEEEKQSRKLRKAELKQQKKQRKLLEKQNQSNQAVQSNQDVDEQIDEIPIKKQIKKEQVQSKKEEIIEKPVKQQEQIQPKKEQVVEQKQSKIASKPVEAKKATEKIEPKIVKKPKITIIEEDDSEEDIMESKKSKKAEKGQKKQNKDSDNEDNSDDLENNDDDDSDLEEIRRVKKQMQESDDENEDEDDDEDFFKKNRKSNSNNKSKKNNHSDDDDEEENFKDLSSNDEEEKPKKSNKNQQKQTNVKKQDEKIKNNKSNKKSEIRNLNEKIKLNHLAICIPDSIISIPQSSELRSYFISELARTAAIFCVDEIIILKDNSYIAKSQNFQQGPYIARNLQYLETPQYLRKQLFPIHPDLKNAGLMNPIECHHHLKSDQYCPYREGVIMNRPVKENDGSWVEIGLKKQAMIPYKLAVNTRVTLRINEPTLEIEQRNYTADLVSQKEPKEKLGLFWGYQVRLADNLNQLFKGENNIKYDIKFLINQGDHEQLSEESLNDTELDFSNKNVLIVFSGYNNLESIVDSDELSKLTGKDALTKFDANFTMQKGAFGVKQLRLEEEMAQALSIIRRQFS